MQYLSTQESAKLLSLITGSDDKSFGTVQAEFSQAFGAQDAFRAGCATALLLEDRAVLRPSQRLSGWFLLHCCGQQDKDIKGNPFASLFVKAAVSKDGTPVEQNFVLQLLQGADMHELPQQTPRSYCAQCSFQLIASAPSPDALQSLYLPRQPSAEGAATDPATGRPQPSSSRGFEPGWRRPVPGVLTPGVHELKWLHVDLGRGLLLDSSMGEDRSRARTVRELLSKAMKGPLLPAQQQQVLAELEADPKLVFQVGLTPRHLPSLVEHTPAVAYEVLVRLQPSRQASEYFSVLAHTEMSLHSMEVVNRLSTAVDLPTEFVHLYITNCINSCESTQDKYVQNRLVRLLCVFLQSLIRNKIINIHDLLHEVQAFCINFSRIREAAKLFRLLKQIETGGKLGEGSPNGMAGNEGGEDDEDGGAQDSKA